MTNWEITLKHLPSYVIYEKFNDTNFFTYNCTDCKPVESAEYKYSGINELCCEMERNLKKLSTILKTVTDKNERCKYLNFWFYYQIWKRFISHREKIYTTSIISKLTYVWGIINYRVNNDKCTDIYHENIPLETWKEMKDLHDYFKNYDTIEKDILHRDRCQSYKNYVEYNDVLYKKHYNECCVSSNKNIENYFNCDERFNPSNLLSKFKCEHKDLALEVNSQKAVALKEEGQTDNSLMSSDMNPVVTVSCTIFVLFFFLLIMYKFTPFGSWLHKRLQQNRIIKYHLHKEETHESLEHEYEIYSRNNENGAHSIGYSSMLS
ncbi:PIR Superfamily Protein [Plasmodium ovale curtisi]|uniref:PIR Superfamily Protein n=1 Tax=Plasmodium ovale curtisi TaxID=864141 RepID=A0A1A8WK02_PLAOA|nr:PIR Superfamily Protein [Plasmodium ovale curtisi]SBT01512.1 PIR Superfamily Protein [Plasmodium ovale curtisi]